MNDSMKDEPAEARRRRRKPTREQARRKAFWKRLASVATVLVGVAAFLLGRRRGA